MSACVPCVTTPSVCVRSVCVAYCGYASVCVCTIGTVFGTENGYFAVWLKEGGGGGGG